MCAMRLRCNKHLAVAPDVLMSLRPEEWPVPFDAATC